MFRIGEFSKLVRVSARMLRYYDKNNLLRPAEIDRFTGYRLYSASQIPLLNSIVVLRDMGFGVEEIEEVLPHLDDAAYMNCALDRKWNEIHVTIATEQSKLQNIAAMRGTLEKERAKVVYEVELKALPSEKVLSLRGIIPAYNQEGLLWEKLCTFMGKNGIEGSPNGYSTYYDEEYKESDVDVEIAVPVDELKESQGEFVFKELESVDLAATIRFSGPYDGGYDTASEKLGQWMEHNNYTFAGPMRGYAIVGPDSDSNSENWMTELQAPVKKA